jgi:major cell surface glycoprotein (TIGR04216 family)
MTANRKPTIALLLATGLCLSVAATGVAYGADVPRSDDRNPSRSPTGPIGVEPPEALHVQETNTSEQDVNSSSVIRTYAGEVAVEDGIVAVSGIARGLEAVLVVLVDSRGRIATETVSVDDDVFEEDDIELATDNGRRLSEGSIRGLVLGLGRDTVVGDGTLPGQERADMAALETWVQNFEPALTQQQVTERILEETVDEGGSDDLLVEQRFRLTDARTSITAVVPREAANQSNSSRFQTRVEPISVGQPMVVRGVTNRRSEDNAVFVEVVDGPSAATFDSGATDEWDGRGVWSVTVSTVGVEPGVYTLEADDGVSTDSVQFEVVTGGRSGAQDENETTGTANATGFDSESGALQT